MSLIRRLVGDSNGKKCNDRREQVQAGVQRLGEDTQAARTENEKRFQGNQQSGRGNAQERRPALFARFLVLLGRHHRLTRLP